MSQRSSDTADEHKARGLCPNISAPFDGCFILRMSSQDISAVLHYCSGAYLLCPVYRRHASKTDEKPPAPETPDQRT